jgi:hypothetical protein
MVAAEQLIAIRDEDLNSKACGSIIFWQLSGGTNARDLAEALAANGSTASAPEEPSATVALHRAVERVARELGGEAHQKKRGSWAIVGKGHVEGEHSIGSEMVYPIKITADLAHGQPVTEGDYTGRIAEAFAAARGVVSPNDFSAWLCRKLDKLGAVALRESGGFYFLPADACGKWEAITKAVKSATKHTIHAVPALRSRDAVDAILSAIASDTRAACEAIANDLPEVGRRALETRERQTAEILEKIGRYENLLGQKLDDLREATRETRAAVAAAMLALDADDA